MKHVLLACLLACSAWAAPTCTQPQQVTRVGSTMTVNVSCTGVTGSPSYLWTKLAPVQSGTSTQPGLAIVSSTAVSTNITGCVFGPVHLRVAVTDMTGTINVDGEHGCTQTDGLGNIQYQGAYAAKVGQLLGPQTIMNRSCDLTSCDTSAGSWADQLQFAWAYHFGNEQGLVPISGGTGVSFVKFWETATSPGTIAIANGGTTVTGTSTAFGDTFCGSHASFPCSPPTTSNFITIWYCTSGTIGGGCLGSLTTSGRRVYAITSVASQTSMTVQGGPSPNWPLASISGTNYSVSGNPGLQAWGGNNVYINYYDCVMAMYATYYRTGIEDFLGFARWLADAWYYSPYRDQYTCDTSGTFNCGFPRVRSLVGIVLRAIDEDDVAGMTGASTKWPNLETYWVNVPSAEVLLRQTTPAFKAISDLRDESYSMGEVSLCAIANPDLTKAQTCLVLGDNQLKSTGRWALQRHTDVYLPWGNLYPENNGNGGPSGAVVPLGNNTGSVTATNGSTTITLVGGTWTSGMFCDPGAKGNITLATDILSGSGWDQRGYVATFVDSTHATLDASYAGTTGSGKYWLLAGTPCGDNGVGWAGQVTQPFMLGITSNMMRLWAYALINSGNAAPFDSTTATAMNGTWLPNIATRLGTDAYNNATCTTPCTPNGLTYKGPWYAVGGALCQSPYGPSGNTNQCYGAATVEESRELSPEMAAAISTGYCLTHDPALLTYGNTYYQAMFAKSSSQAGYDGGYIADMDINGFFWNTWNGKWLGFFWGYGRNQSWLSASQGCGAGTLGGSALSGVSLMSGTGVLR